MTQYHVGCGLAGIYAGTYKKGLRNKWLHKSDVTSEAIKAVATYMYSQIPEDSTEIAYHFKMGDGKVMRMKVEVIDDCPEWLKEFMKGN